MTAAHVDCPFCGRRLAGELLPPPAWARPQSSLVARADCSCGGHVEWESGADGSRIRRARVPATPPQWVGR